MIDFESIKDTAATVRAVSVWRHVAALAYVLGAGALVVRFGACLEPSTNFGDFFPQRIDYPVFYWALTVAYAGVALHGIPWKIKQAVANTLALGLLLHFNLLSLALIGDDATVSTLTAAYFIHYVHGILELILIVTNAISFRHVAGALRSPSTGFWLPAAYLPLVNLALGPPGWVVPAVAIGAAVAVVVPRVRPWAIGTRLWIKSQAIVADPRMFMGGVLLLALVMRLTASLRLASMGFETVLLNSDDAQQYDMNARNILDGLEVSSRSENLSDYSSGYSLFVALLYGLTGRNLTAVLVIQAVVSSLVPVALYWVGRRCYGETAARVGAVLAALSQLLIFNSVNLTREMLSLALILPMIGMLQFMVPGGRSERAAGIAAGGLLGLLILVDPVFIVVALAFSLIYVLRALSDVPRRVWVIGILWCAIYGTAVPLKSFVVPPRNLAEIVSLNTRPKEFAVLVSTEYSPYATELYERGINLFAYPRQSFVNALDDPLETAVLIGKKVWLDFRRFFLEGNTGRFYPLLLIANSSFGANVLFYSVLCGVLGLAASIRRVRSSDSQWETGIFLLTMVAYAVPYIVLFFGLTRFRAAVQPILVLWIGIGASTAVRWMVDNSLTCNADQRARCSHRRQPMSRQPPSGMTSLSM